MSTENTSFRFTAEEETPVHGHTELTEEQVEAVNEQLRDIADVPAIEIISSAAIHMMSAAAVKCGLAADENADDLGWANLGPIGSYISKINPDFDSRLYGYGKLSDLIKSFDIFEHRTDNNQLQVRRRL